MVSVTLPNGSDGTGSSSGSALLMGCAILLGTISTASSASDDRGHPPSPPLPLVKPCSVPFMEFCNTSLSIAERAAALVSKLTVEEKVAQLSTYSFAKKYSHRFTPPVKRIGLCVFSSSSHDLPLCHAAQPLLLAER